MADQKIFAGPRIRRLNGGLWQLSGPRIHDERHQRPYPRVEEDRAHEEQEALHWHGVRDS